MLKYSEIDHPHHFLIKSLGAHALIYLSRYVYHLSEIPICLSKQSNFATNSPISFIFNFRSRDMSRDHN